MNPQTTVLQGLTRLFTEGGDGNFVIFAAGPYYVQFAGGRGEPTAQMEVVSNQFLGEEVAIGPDQESKLETMGFGRFDSRSNWSKEVVLGAEASRVAIAAEVVEVFVDVFGLAHLELDELEVELNLDEKFRLENPDLRRAIQEGDGITATLAEAFVYLPVLRNDDGTRTVFNIDGRVVLITEEAGIEAWRERVEEEHVGSIAPFVEIAGWLGERDLVINPVGPYEFALDASEVSLILRRHGS